MRVRRVLGSMALVGLGLTPLLVSSGQQAGASQRLPMGPTSSSTAIVSLGDSFISGEAGRWRGNSTNNLASRNGTDRAYRSAFIGWYYDYEAVYRATVSNGCHRSDVAPVKSTTISVTEKINLACSGAETKHVWRASQGGQSFRGEAPQADQLAAVAASKNVKMVVLSIGGNDLGFADVITACTLKFSTTPTAAPDYCNDEQGPLVNSKMTTAMANVGKSIDEIRAVMTAAGYTNSQYRLVLVSYPSPLPRGAEIRYSQSGFSRLNTGGCPFWNADANWARDTLVPTIANNLRVVANAKAVEFLDYRDAFEDKENCSTSTSQAGSGGPSATTSEWARWVGTGLLQGDLQESVHPNAYGQQALGRCLTLLYAKPAGGKYKCNNGGAGTAPTAMTITAV